MDVPKLEDLNSSTCTERSIKLHYPEFYEYIISLYPETLSWSEKLYWYYHDLQDYPKCICGNRTKFVNLKTGYREFCGYSCMNKNVQNRREETFEKKYGTKNPMKSQTVIDKLSHTVFEKYGTSNVFGNKEVQKKIQRTNLIKYGVKYPMQSKDIVSKMLKTRNNIMMEKDPSILSISDDLIYTVRCPHLDSCNKCHNKTFEIPGAVLYDRRRLGSEQCTTLSPIGKYIRGTSVELFVRRILDEHNVVYEPNVRDIISPQELDIYIPSKKICIECNGIYWHNANFRPGKYHMDKFKRCKEKGIQLITIWEDWIMCKPDIVESIILSKLGLSKNKIGARECEIKEVCVKDCNHFLESNHIQGKTPSKVRIGLYKDNQLVSIMCFGPRQTMASKKAGEWDLIRFCNVLDCNVIGAASRLLKCFIEHYNPKMIYSFSSNDISNGNLYKKLGFKEDNMNLSYWYIDKGFRRYHRSAFTKDAIVKKGWKENKNGWTESEVMKEHGYFQVYDSGQTKWEYKIVE